MKSGKTDFRKKLRGTVLIMVVTVMFVLMIFLMATLAVVSSANKRAFVKFEENQAYYSAASALEVFWTAMLNDGKYYAKEGTTYNTSSQVRQYYNVAGDTGARVLTQGRAFELDLYSLKAPDLVPGSNGVDSAFNNLTIPGTSLNGTDVIDELNATINADAILYFSTDTNYGTQFMVKKDLSSNYIPSVDYTVTYPAIGTQGYGKFADETDTAVISINVLDRYYDMANITRQELNDFLSNPKTPTNPTGNSLPTAFWDPTTGDSLKTAIERGIQNGDRAKDTFKIRVTAKTELMGVLGSASVELSTGAATASSPPPPSNSAIMSGGNIDVRGNSLPIIGGMSTFGSISAIESSQAGILYSEQDYLIEQAGRLGFQTVFGVGESLTVKGAIILENRQVEFESLGGGAFVYANDGFVSGPTDPQFGKAPGTGYGIDVFVNGNFNPPMGGGDIYGNLFADSLANLIPDGRGNTAININKASQDGSATNTAGTGNLFVNKFFPEFNYSEAGPAAIKVDGEIFANEYWDAKKGITVNGGNIYTNNFYVNSSSTAPISSTSTTIYVKKALYLDKNYTVIAGQSSYPSQTIALGISNSIIIDPKAEIYCQTNPLYPGTPGELPVYTLIAGGTVGGIDYDLQTALINTVHQGDGSSVPALKFTDYGISFPINITVSSAPVVEELGLDYYLDTDYDPATALRTLKLPKYGASQVQLNLTGTTQDSVKLNTTESVYEEFFSEDFYYVNGGTQVGNYYVFEDRDSTIQKVDKDRYAAYLDGSGTLTQDELLFIHGGNFSVPLTALDANGNPTAMPTARSSFNYPNRVSDAPNYIGYYPQLLWYDYLDDGWPFDDNGDHTHFEPFADVTGLPNRNAVFDTPDNDYVRGAWFNEGTPSSYAHTVLGNPTPGAAYDSVGYRYGAYRKNGDTADGNKNKITGDELQYYFKTVEKQFPEYVTTDTDGNKEILLSSFDSYTPISVKDALLNTETITIPVTGTAQTYTIGTSYMINPGGESKIKLTDFANSSVNGNIYLIDARSSSVEIVFDTTSRTTHPSWFPDAAAGKSVFKLAGTYVCIGDNPVRFIVPKLDTFDNVVYMGGSGSNPDVGYFSVWRGEHYARFMKNVDFIASDPDAAKMTADTNILWVISSTNDIVVGSSADPNINGGGSITGTTMVSGDIYGYSSDIEFTQGGANLLVTYDSKKLRTNPTSTTSDAHIKVLGSVICGSFGSKDNNNPATVLKLKGGGGGGASIPAGMPHFNWVSNAYDSGIFVN